MTADQLKQITHTVEGYPVKDLRYKSIDNIIVGLAYSPLYGNPNLHDGFIAVTWKTNGKTTTKYKGVKELDLKIPEYV